MVMVVSHAGKIAGEADLINAMFGAGLERFHLRKPDTSEWEVRALMDAIDPVYYPKIAWHQYHHLVLHYNTKRLHFPAWMRACTSDATWNLLMEAGCILSTSIHADREAGALAPVFTYTFAGPVFDSISKVGYSALPPAQRERLALQDKVIQRVAIGGIHDRNCTVARTFGVKSIAVSGAVWQHAQPLLAFKNIQKAWHITGPSY